jgi:hypothetical protein
MLHRSRLLRGVGTILAAAVSLSFMPLDSATPMPAVHPHFPKTLTCKVTPQLTVTVGYQTVTFNAKAAEALEAGKAWHLAGATFETTGDLIIGEREVPAGRYALSARKVGAKAWELVLHQGGGFSTKIGADAHVLKTAFADGQPVWEHLNIDVQPGGDKKNTQLYLDVYFDSLRARALIQIPE